VFVHSCKGGSEAKNNKATVLKNTYACIMEGWGCNTVENIIQYKCWCTKKQAASLLFSNKLMVKYGQPP